MKQLLHLFIVFLAVCTLNAMEKPSKVPSLRDLAAKILSEHAISVETFKSIPTDLAELIIIQTQDFKIIEAFLEALADNPKSALQVHTAKHIVNVIKNQIKNFKTQKEMDSLSSLLAKQNQEIRKLLTITPNEMAELIAESIIDSPIDNFFEKMFLLNNYDEKIQQLIAQAFKNLYYTNQEMIDKTVNKLPLGQHNILGLPIFPKELLGYPKQFALTYLIIGIYLQKQIINILDRFNAIKVTFGDLNSSESQLFKKILFDQNWQKEFANTLEILQNILNTYTPAQPIAHSSLNVSDQAKKSLQHKINILTPFLKSLKN